ncbi:MULTISPECIES: GNAT family N-acetyltransferase [Paracoccus]|uniref:Acetyltransferase (GNAT) family protein n=1 Tax=Paracoccus versutus TaxID=34007 RepID=A0A3D9XCR9_PARVE|nr:MULTISPECIES: GNAT family N-acetyltransferase [Paracoccus]REF67441.1 acetyltransferase (GNAT) family protein [Paracoccus versutus]WGR58604.1 GNAT family N-acetyltransferase [Paracoccus versutus]
MIRALRPDDRKGWQRLYEGYQAFYGFADRPPSFYDRAFGRLMARDPRDFHGLVAEADGRLLGLTHYVFHPNLWRDEGVCYLQDLFTAPEARGRGIARALIEGVYAEADRAGIPAVYWLTAEDNYPGRMLYDRVGQKSPFIRYNRKL